MARQRRLSLVAAGLTVALLGLVGAARADPMSVVNELRMNGCTKREAAGVRVRPRPELDAAARELAHVDRIGDALERAGYAAASATSFHIRGPQEDTLIRNLLGQRFCEAVNDPRYEEIGVFTDADETWIVLAVRQVPDAPLNELAVAQRVLDLVNAARAEARRCGDDDYAAVPPLRLSTLLNAAASVHARDMARHARLSHEGSDGSLAGDRITRAGYTWHAAAENVAAGQRDADTVVAAWLASPGHCANLMGPYFADMGIAFALAPDRDPEIYWAQAFAAP